jgi:hypothetical protein
MNKELLAHRAWQMQTKLCYGYDSVAYISTTKSYDRLSGSSVYGRCQALKNVLNETMKKVKVVNNNGYYNEGSSLRVYFNVSDKEACDVLLNIIAKNAHHYEFLEVKTPKNQAHLDMMNNKEITQVIRNKLYHNQYVYSVKILLERDTSHLSQWNHIRARDRVQKASTMNKWFRDAMPDTKSSVWHDEIQLFTNDVSPLVMFRLTYDVKSCKIKEAILLEQEDNEPEQHETGILI